MLELISIHIPKTGGQSFYHILEQVYGEQVSISYQRKDYKAATEQYASFEESLPAELRVLHGHLYYQEVKSLHKVSQAKVICWLRDPIERVVSNYYYFINRLEHNVQESGNSHPDAHRREETLLQYAGHRDTRNRMSKFLKGISLEELYFIGFLEDYEADLQRLGQRMGWPKIEIPHINKGKKPQRDLLDEKTLRKLRRWNRKDIKLYEKARKLSKNQY